MAQTLGKNPFLQSEGLKKYTPSELHMPRSSTAGNKPQLILINAEILKKKKSFLFPYGKVYEQHLALQIQLNTTPRHTDSLRTCLLQKTT